MAEASRWFVNLDELMEAAGRRLAELTLAEWGIVTCGSAAAVALGTAACVAGNDPLKMLRLPFTGGMVDRVLMPKSQRFAYDQAVRMIGCRIVEVETRADLDKALDEPVALVVLLGKLEHCGPLRLEDFAAAAQPRHIPIMVDAASEHLERPSPWLVRGADLVVYSGGKFLRGPQTSGLLLGRKALVEAAWRNASPHQALGRPMKVSKEDIVGAVAAVEHWFAARDREAERRQWYADLALIAERIGRLPGAATHIVEPEGVDLVPRLKLSWDRWHYPTDGLDLRQRVLDGEPRIMLDDNSATENEIEIDPFQLQPGEAAAVAAAVVAALRASECEEPRAVRPSQLEVAGEWELRLYFLHGARVHRLTIGQSGCELSGRHEAPGFGGPLVGWLEDNTVQLLFTLRFEASTLSYHFDGEIRDGEIRGAAVLGAANDHHGGIVNRSQFGVGRWRARRIG
jgi:L-seryl-tRNA(Ser) seleniumtransferase